MYKIPTTLEEDDLTLEEIEKMCNETDPVKAAASEETMNIQEKEFLKRHWIPNNREYD